MRGEDRDIPMEASPPPPNLPPGKPLSSRLLYRLRSLLDLMVASVLRALKPWPALKATSWKWGAEPSPTAI